MDYKLPSSNMEDKMNLNNFKYLSYKDTVKFVCWQHGRLTKV